MHRSGNGDRAAFAAFYDELAPIIFGIATLGTTNLVTAGDLTVATFVKLWEGAGSFDASQGSSTERAVREVRRQILGQARPTKLRLEQDAPH